MTDAFKTAPMSSKLVAFEGFEAILAAWRLSRPNDQTPNLADVLKMDTPVNEFCSLTFEMHAPIIVRELITGLRDHVVWAQSSRVEDLDNWTIWDGAVRGNDKNRLEINSLRFYMDVLKTKGAHQDEFRMALPLGFMTKFTFRMSLRRFVGTFNAMETEIKYPELISTVLNALIIEIPYEGSLKEVVVARANYKPPEFYLDTSETFTTGVIGDHVAFTAQIPFALRAQLVRHRATIVKSNMRGLLRQNAMAYPISRLINCQILMDIGHAKNLLTERACWIAQSDLWEGIARPLRAALVAGGALPNPTGGEGAPSLPCDAAGACPYVRDNELRLAGRDPAPPCPRAARLANAPLSMPHAGKATQYAHGRPYRVFWLNEIVKLGGRVCQ